MARLLSHASAYAAAVGVDSARVWPGRLAVPIDRAVDVAERIIDGE